MSIIYKLKLNKDIPIREIDQLVDQINFAISSIGLSIMDFNVESFEFDQTQSDITEDSLLPVHLDMKLNYISGYLKFHKNGDFDVFLKLFKKEILKSLGHIVDKVLVQNPNGLILDENFVEIP